MEELPDDAASYSAKVTGNSLQSKRFVVKKCQAQALWAWNMAVDILAICRNQIIDVCIECQVNSE